MCEIAWIKFRDGCHVSWTLAPIPNKAACFMNIQQLYPTLGRMFRYRDLVLKIDDQATRPHPLQPWLGWQTQLVH